MGLLLGVNTAWGPTLSQGKDVPCSTLPVAATKMSLPEKMSRAWEILSGLGMAVAGVKT